jgi:hypothetical protein
MNTIANIKKAFLNKPIIISDLLSIMLIFYILIELK